MHNKTVDRFAARAQIERELASKIRDARAAFHDNIVEFFRVHIVGKSLGAAQASADHLKESYPAAWGEAVRQGPLGERRL